MKCFYHSADFDGKCSGAIVKLAQPDAELIGIDYGDPFPWERVKQNETVYIVDFTIQPYEDMQRLHELCTLIWIDHHKTSLEWADKAMFNPSGIRRLELAGCELTWFYFHGFQADEVPPTPLAVTLLGRYDIWKHQNEPRCMPFQFGMRLCAHPPEDTAWWHCLMTGEAMVNDIIDTGKIIQAYQEQAHAAVCAYAAQEIDWEGLHWIALNGPYRSSQVFDSVYDPAKHDAMLCYGRCKTQWRYGLYTTKPDVDVSVIAKKYGGGGHKGAAGFQSETCVVPLT